MTPELIFKKEKYYSRLMVLIDAHRRRLELREAQLTRDVIYERGDDGKYKYSNESTRGAEFTLRKNKDARWTTYNQRLLKMENGRRVALAEIDREARLFKLKCYDREAELKARE